MPIARIHTWVGSNWFSPNWGGSGPGLMGGDGEVGGQPMLIRAQSGLGKRGEGATADN